MKKSCIGLPKDTLDNLENQLLQALMCLLIPAQVHTSLIHENEWFMCDFSYKKNVVPHNKSIAAAINKHNFVN